MENPTLVKPDIKYKGSYIEALKEYKEADGDTLDIDERERNFEEFISKLEKDTATEDENKVPSFTYWCVIGDRYIGKINYRPKLNVQLRFKGGNVGYSIRPTDRGKGYATLMLNEIIEKAKADGLTELLITCDTLNEGSKSVIKKCGGVYQDGGFDEKDVEIDRYIIDLK